MGQRSAESLVPRSVQTYRRDCLSQLSSLLSRSLRAGRVPRPRAPPQRSRPPSDQGRRRGAVPARWLHADDHAGDRRTGPRFGEGHVPGLRDQGGSAARGHTGRRTRRRSTRDAVRASPLARRDGRHARRSVCAWPRSWPARPRSSPSPSPPPPFDPELAGLRARSRATARADLHALAVELQLRGRLASGVRVQDAADPCTQSRTTQACTSASPANAARTRRAMPTSWHAHSTAGAGAVDSRELLDEPC
jgi:hypothetical protein